MSLCILRTYTNIEKIYRANPGTHAFKRQEIHYVTELLGRFRTRTNDRDLLFWGSFCLLFRKFSNLAIGKNGRIFQLGTGPFALGTGPFSGGTASVGKPRSLVILKVRKGHMSILVAFDTTLGMH